MNNQLVNHSLKRVSAFLCEIDRIDAGDFPYRDSHDALDEIQKRFRYHERSIKKLLDPSDEKDMEPMAINRALEDMFVYLPLLGFILRSTNVRNSFEMYRPFLFLCQRVLKNDVKLVLSSEWDYSPYTYVTSRFTFPLLNNYILIGLPACESSNPLLLPLAGHELGHSIWARAVVPINNEQIPLFQIISSKIESIIISELTSKWKSYINAFPHEAREKISEHDLLSELAPWRQACHWALLQSEETFCDFIGVKMFGESYLHAFAYLLAPSQSLARPEIYPNIKTRVSNLVLAGRSYNCIVTEQFATYSSLFTYQPDPDDNIQHKMLLSLADHALDKISNQLISYADSILTDSGIPSPDESLITKIHKEYFARLLVPAANAESLCNILNAGWRMANDSITWKDDPRIKDKDKALSNLILKSLEVFEVEQRLGGTE